MFIALVGYMGYIIVKWLSEMFYLLKENIFVTYNISTAITFGGIKLIFLS